MMPPLCLVFLVGRLALVFLVSGRDHVCDPQTQSIETTTAVTVIDIRHDRSFHGSHLNGLTRTETSSRLYK